MWTCYPSWQKKLCRSDWGLSSWTQCSWSLWKGHKKVRVRERGDDSRSRGWVIGEEDVTQETRWASGNWKLYDVYAFLIDITSKVVKKWICLSLVSQNNTFSVPSTSLHGRLLLLTAGGYVMPSLSPITPSAHSIPKCSGVTTRLHEASVSLDTGHFFSIGIAGS